MLSRDVERVTQPRRNIVAMKLEQVKDEQEGVGTYLVVLGLFQRKEPITR